MSPFLKIPMARPPVAATEPENTGIARLLYDSFNERDFKKALSVTSARLEWFDMPLGMSFAGKRGYRKYARHWLQAFPDAKVSISRFIASADCLVVEYTGLGTHTGRLVAATGQILPTGRSIKLNVCDVLRIRDGKVVLGQTYYDLVELLGQLGIPTAEAAA